MDFNFSKKHLLFIGLACSVVFVAGLVDSKFFNNALFSLTTVVGIVLFSFLVIMKNLKQEIRKVVKANNSHYQQIEAIFSLTNILNFKCPLPPMRGWAASPDFLLKISETILTVNPRLVVEASSGISTLTTAYCLKRLGGGKVVSLEHDSVYVEKTQNLLKLHGMEDYANVIHAPLVEHVIDGKSWQWYDMSNLKDINNIDLLIIDGPPERIQKRSRYPAIPLLYDKLSRGCVVLLDDGAREDETQISKLWEKQFHFDSVEFIGLEKGAWTFVKSV